MADVLSFSPLPDRRDSEGNLHITGTVITDLEQRRMLRDMEEQASVNLPVAAPTDVYLTTLTFEEQRMFLEVLTIAQDLGDFQQNLLADKYEHAARMLRETGPKNLQLAFNADESSVYYEMAMRQELIGSMLWYAVRCRTNSFNTVLKVCAGYQVVVIGNKYAT